ncbi:MAG TPA: methyltransferase domain-containing protein [Pseudomonadota bacterium]|nr:methyltransferase domain-containing protein [Pseudomonadota bacterium]
MDQGVYELEAEIEEHHWWFIGRRRLFSTVIRSLGLSPSARILDMGTSTGTNLRLLHDLGFSQVMGLDVSMLAARSCQEKQLGPVIVGSARDLPFADESFDLVLATDILEHLDDDADGLREIARVLVPCGRVLLTVPAFQSLWSPHDEVAHHKRRYRVEALREKVEQAGLSVDDSYYFNFLLFPSIWLTRQAIRGLRLPFRNENKLNTPLLNRVFDAVFSVDVKLAPQLRVPFGVSALCLSHKPKPSARPSPQPLHSEREQTIDDFGEQWTRYTDNEGFYGSVELLKDIFGPLLSVDDLSGQRVAEIGSGTGRIVAMMLEAGAGHAVAVEPSSAIVPMQNNLAKYGDRVTCLHIPGEELPSDLGLDYVFSIGVIHHIPDPRPVLRAMYESLRPGGRCLIWLYGYEGNEPYLNMVLPLRRLTTKLPHAALSAVSHGLNLALDGYMLACRHVDLPLKHYLDHVLSKFSREKRHLVIYDQLNPAWAHYYRRDEAEKLLRDAGFVDIKLHHRHGYSWTVMGTRPHKDSTP